MIVGFQPSNHQFTWHPLVTEEEVQKLTLVSIIKKLSGRGNFVLILKPLRRTSGHI